MSVETLQIGMSDMILQPETRPCRHAAMPCRSRAPTPLGPLRPDNEYLAHTSEPGHDTGGFRLILVPLPISFFATFWSLLAMSSLLGQNMSEHNDLWVKTAYPTQRLVDSVPNMTKLGALRFGRFGTIKFYEYLSRMMNRGPAV